MIQAKQLMIGDYIQFGSDNNPNFLTDIHQITCIDDFNNEIHADGEIYGLDCFRIKPIPLTPEILEKNGFRNGYIRIFYDPYTRIEMEMQYVHDLQHFLRLCGIEKEIEL